MRNIQKLFLTIAIFFISSAFAENVLQDWPQGYKKHNELLEFASSDEKPVLVYFYTDWCPYCKRLNREYLSSPEFQELSSGIYRVQINPEKSKPDNRLFTVRYGGTGYPSVYVYIPKLSEYRNNLTPFFKDGDLTPEEYVQLISATICQAYNKKAFDLYKSNNLGSARNYLLKSLAYDLQNKHALLLLGSVYQKEGSEKNDKKLIGKARQLFKKVLTIYPGDKDALAALGELNN